MNLPLLLDKNLIKGVFFYKVLSDNKDFHTYKSNFLKKNFVKYKTPTFTIKVCEFSHRYDKLW